METPTCEQLFNEELKSIKVTDQSGWRHGVDREEIFYRESDGTYWGASYRVSTDGGTHGLREGDAYICKVKPVKVEVIEYVFDKDSEVS